jgi:hypothetical protein
MINEHQGFHVITDCDPGDCDKDTCVCIKEKGANAPSSTQQQ